MEVFKLVYKIGNIELELNGSQDFIDKERGIFFKKLPEFIELQAAPIEYASSSNQENNYVNTKEQSTVSDTNKLEYESIVEFLNCHNFTTKKETILGMAYFIDCIKKDCPVGTGKINTLYDESRQKKSNTSEFLAQLVKSGDLMPVNGRRGAYKLTKQGIDLVNKRHK
jgi:predicted transcriptional regulator